jgi:hypothetical protein
MTTETGPLIATAVASGQRVAAERDRRLAETQAAEAAEAARRAVPPETVAQRFVTTARLVAEGIDAHATAAGITLGPEPVAGPRELAVRVRSFATDDRPRLTLQCRDRTALVRLQGVSRGEEWAPIDLDAPDFDAATIASRVLAAWIAEASGIAPHVPQEVRP